MSRGGPAPVSWSTFGAHWLASGVFPTVGLSLWSRKRGVRTLFVRLGFSLVRGSETGTKSTADRRVSPTLYRGGPRPSSLQTGWDGPLLVPTLQ